MKPAARFAIVLVTAPNLKTARALARAALSARLIACANLVPKIESHYWWQGKIESGTEVLMIFKTTKSRLTALEKLLLAKHPYDTPEILALPPQSGTEKYLAWLDKSCGEK
jgi:periplasmic divalent cation tolerance protein